MTEFADENCQWYTRLHNPVSIRSTWNSLLECNRFSKTELAKVFPRDWNKLITKCSHTSTSNVSDLNFDVYNKLSMDTQYKDEHQDLMMPNKVEGHHCQDVNHSHTFFVTHRLTYHISANFLRGTPDVQKQDFALLHIRHRQGLNFQKHYSHW